MSELAFRSTMTERFAGFVSENVARRVAFRVASPDGRLPILLPRSCWNRFEGCRYGFRVQWRFFANDIGEPMLCGNFGQLRLSIPSSSPNYYGSATIEVHLNRWFRSETSNFHPPSERVRTESESLHFLWRSGKCYLRRWSRRTRGLAYEALRSTNRCLPLDQP